MACHRCNAYKKKLNLLSPLKLAFLLLTAHCKRNYIINRQFILLSAFHFVSSREPCTISINTFLLRQTVRNCPRIFTTIINFKIFKIRMLDNWILKFLHLYPFNIFFHGGINLKLFFFFYSTCNVYVKSAKSAWNVPVKSPFPLCESKHRESLSNVTAQQIKSPWNLTSSRWKSELQIVVRLLLPRRRIHPK